MASKRSFLGFVTSPLFLIGSLLIWILFQKKKSTLSPEELTEIKNLITSKLQAAGYSDRFASYWWTVFNFETGRGTSNLAVNYNNLFGMKWYDGAPYTYVKIGVNKWGVFTDFANAIDIQVAYIKRKGYAKDYKTLRDLAVYMKSVGYFEEPLDQYYTGLNSYA